MNVKRAIMFGALLWVLIFFEVSVLMFGFGLEVGKTFYIIHYILLLILVLFVSLFYFRGKIKRGFSEGILVGLVFVVVGVILDVVITVPLFIKDYGAFFNLGVLIGLLETIFVVGIAGGLKK